MIDLSPLWLSLRTACLATGITVLLGTVAASWMLGYRGRWRSLIEAALISPLVLPPTVVGFLLLILLGRRGLLGPILSALSINVVFTWSAAVITAVVVAFPLMYRTTLGALQQIDPSLIAAASTLGASRWRVFWRVMVPLALPGIIAGGTLAFTRALGEFGATLMLAGNIPGQTQTLPMAIYFAVEAGAMQQAFLWTLVILGISLGTLIGVNGWQRQYTHRRRAETTPSTVKVTTFPTARSEPLLLGDETQSGGLWVNMRKQLPNFQLQAQFSIDHNNRPLGLLGASGSGKSLILRCIAGIESPDSGQIRLNHRVLFDSTQIIDQPSHQRKVGVVFQNYALFPHLTVAENIAFGLPDYLPLSDTQQQVDHYLATVHLQGLEHRYPRQLSGGQQQRVALARALASQPDLLLLDEPFSALDTHLRHQLEQQMLEILDAYTGIAILVTHNMEEAFRICQNLVIVDQGTIVAQGDKHTLFAHPPTATVAQVTGCHNYSQARDLGSGQIKAEDWDCVLQISPSLPNNFDQVGLRAHDITFPDTLAGENTFACWLVKLSETPDRMRLFLKLNHPPNHLGDYHLEAEVLKDQWKTLNDQALPWIVQLDPQKLMLFKA